MPEQSPDLRPECPYCHVTRLHIPAFAKPQTPIYCKSCEEYLGTWDELQSLFEQQGGQDGIFSLDKGRIRRVD